jgi:Zn-dependent protease/CBS domain-containing protein
MRPSFRLGKVFGVEIGIHYSWFLIAAVVLFSLSGYFQSVNEEWGVVIVWGFSILTTLLFFVTLVLHELSHALVARRRGLPVRNITLFALGGVAQIEREADSPTTEFLVGIAGPVTSLIIGLISIFLSLLIGLLDLVTLPLQSVFLFLGAINIALAIFNMIPGFPLDGGRVLRAIVWWLTGNESKSTRIAARGGQLVALIFIAMGLYRAFTGEGFGGLWMSLIGLFLLQASRASHMQVYTAEKLAGLKVSDCMRSGIEIISGFTNLQTCVDEHFAKTPDRALAVEEQGRVAGIVTPREIGAVERARWPYVTVDHIMVPIEEVKTVDIETPITEALNIMASTGFSVLIVVGNGAIAGTLLQSDVLQILQNRAELHV